MNFDHAPEWFTHAVHEIGTREEPDNKGPAIRRYIALAHTGAEGQPWCAIFTNAMLELASVPGSRSPSSQSFRHNANFVQMAGPVLGAIAVFWRGSKQSGLGHVGFYRGELHDQIYVLGGNEGDMVQIEPFPRNGATFGLVGYFWPAGIPVPPVAPVIMPAGTPAHTTAPDKVV